MKKSVVLVVVIGVMLVISILALAALHLMTQESRLAEHKISRIRGFFAAQAGVVDALECMSRPIGACEQPAGSGNLKNGNIQYNISALGQGLTAYPLGGLNVNIRIPPAGPNPTRQIEVTVDY